MIAFFIVALSTKTLRNALFVDLTNLIIEKMVVMIRTATEEKVGIKRCFGTFLSLLFRSIGLQTRSHNCCNGTKRNISRMPK
jgi:hypothetical protein